MDYLTRWRMLVAANWLTNSRDPVSAIALSLGYESESAFSTAFKRVMVRSPRQYGRGRSPDVPSELPAGQSRDGLVQQGVAARQDVEIVSVPTADDAGERQAAGADCIQHQTLARGEARVGQ